jgi:UDP-glucuronate 4-epimerase
MTRKPERVVVTGGLGFIGSRLCAALLSEGRSVVCVDDLRGPYAPSAGRAAARRLSRLGAQLIEADAGTAVLPQADAVVHLAALPGVRTNRAPGAIRRANTLLTKHLLASAARAGARFVLASTSSVYGNARILPTPEETPPAPLNDYAASKVAAEQAVRAAARAGVAALGVRLFTVYGPGQRPDMAFARWIEALAHGRPLHWCAPRGAARDFTYVDDAVDGLMAALDHGRAGALYNVSGGRPVPLARALALLEEITGRRSRLRRVSASGREAQLTSGCGLRAAGEIGYHPRVDLATGLRLQVAALDGATSRSPHAPARVPHGRSRSGWGSGAGAPGRESPHRDARPAAATSRG